MSGAVPIAAFRHASTDRIRRLGIGMALVALVIDQSTKLWLLRVFDLPGRQQVRLMPWLDLVMAWNRGISYSLLTADSDAGRWLLIAGTLAAIGLLGVWLWRVHSPLTGVALGLLIGGALGNVIDRIAYGAVADFVYFHVGAFHWYVFNGADCAIVLGVALLLVDMVSPHRETAAQTPPARP
ncbi:MAG TPA: signal peptidase II [Lichenihabitans sp.]|jgi:signal peptidase II|nr:signal peptidase II [Lichenihabitans sp.]